MRYTLIVLLLAGCQSAPQQPQYTWQKPGATEDEFNIDQGQCRAQGLGSPFGPMSYQAAAVFMSCMQGKGWRQVQR